MGGVLESYYRHLPIWEEAARRAAQNSLPCDTQEFLAPSQSAALPDPLQKSPKVSGCSSDRDRVRPREGNGTPESEEERRHAIHDTLHREHSRSFEVQREQMPMDVDMEGVGSPCAVHDIHQHTNGPVQDLDNSTDSGSNHDQAPLDPTRWWDQWARGVDKQRLKHEWRITALEGKLGQDEDQLQRVQTQLGVLFGTLNDTQQRLTAVAEDSQWRIQTLQEELRQRNEFATQSIADRLQCAKLELEVRAQELLGQLQQLWLSEKAEVREGVLRSLLEREFNPNFAAQSVELLTLKEQALREIRAAAQEAQQSLSPPSGVISMVTPLHNAFSQHLQQHESYEPRRLESERVVELLVQQVTGLTTECSRLRETVREQSGVIQVLQSQVSTVSSRMDESSGSGITPQQVLLMSEVTFSKTRSLSSSPRTTSPCLPSPAPPAATWQGD